MTPPANIWASTATCAHRLFEEQVLRTPDADAVLCGGQTLSYRVLNARSNQLARRLTTLGVGPEVRVAIAVGRSSEMMTSILAVLKAGGAYLPLDPTAPLERTAFMLRDASAALVLTERRWPATIPSSVATLFVDEEPLRAVSSDDVPDVDGGATASNLAYVIYTSGSTGRPKGVMAQHSCLVNYLRWCTKAYGVCEGRLTPVHSPLSFDLTITALFAPLMVGGAVLMVPDGPDVRAGIAPLAEVLTRNTRSFTLIKVTPVHLDLLATGLTEAAAASAAGVFVIGGEALFDRTVAFWRAHAPATRLVNEYGPTETVVGCAAYEIPAGPPRMGPVPIGRAIANTELHVLNDQIGPAEAGELYIGGEGVTRGYLARPGLTAERFIPDPFSGRPGARLYRSGDVVRRLPDGNLVYVGRTDDQVKLRGYRIELDEIGAVLRDHAAVRDACVVLREAPGGEPCLVAYLVARQVPPPIADLRGHLGARLPDYMVPAAYVFLDELPLTYNGKLDRASLPAPDWRSQAAPVFVPPKSDDEEFIATLWREFLGFDEIGRHDNFFELGGNSVSAARLILLLQDAFGVELPPDTLFENPVLAELADELARLQRGAASDVG